MVDKSIFEGQKIVDLIDKSVAKAKKELLRLNDVTLDDQTIKELHELRNYLNIYDCGRRHDLPPFLMKYYDMVIKEQNPEYKVYLELKEKFEPKEMNPPYPNYRIGINEKIYNPPTTNKSYTHKNYNYKNT